MLYSNNYKDYYIGMKRHLQHLGMATIVGILGVAVINILLLQKPVLAEPGRPASEMNLTEQVNSYTYYYAWSYCIENKAIKGDGGSLIENNLSPTNFRNGTWFTNGDALVDVHSYANVGYNSRNKTPPEIDCYRSESTTDPLNTWGMGGDKVKTLEAMGFQRNEDGFWKHKDGKPATGIFSHIRKEVWGGKAPSLTPAAKYQFYKVSFEKGCQAKATDDQTAKSLADAGNDKRYVKMASGYDAATGNTKYSYYKLGLDADRQIDVIEPNGDINSQLPGLGDGKANCWELAKGAEEFASAYAEATTEDPTLTDGEIDSETEEAEEKQTCQGVDAIGWIVCPVSKAIGKAIDAVYTIIQHFLTLQPVKKEVDGQTTGIYRAWGVMRDIANAGFIILFLVVIYAQLTGGGRR